jgi:hypothetical protein
LHTRSDRQNQHRRFFQYLEALDTFAFMSQQRRDRRRARVANIKPNDLGREPST